jgi:hypothetical protein
MLQRFISFILVFSLIGYGTTWAFDGRAFERAAHAKSGMHGQSELGDDGSQCDHCCHAAAHMLGIYSPLPTLIRPQPDSFHMAVDRLAATLAHAPPIKPPRS